MDALSGSGVPVLAGRGVGGGWSLVDDYQTRLTGLTPPEIQSLFLSGPPRLMADLELKRESETAFLKLQASLPAHARRHAEEGAAPHPDRYARIARRCRVGCLLAGIA